MRRFLIALAVGLAAGVLLGLLLYFTSPPAKAGTPFPRPTPYPSGWIPR